MSARMRAVLGCAGEVRLIAGFEHAGFGELAHVARGVDEEHVVVLQHEVVRLRLAVGREQLGAGHAEELDRDPAGGAEVGCQRCGVAGEAHPRGVALAGEHADAQPLGQVRADGEDPAGDAVGLEEHGAQHRVLAAADAPAHDDAHEHLDERGYRVGVTVAFGRVCPPCVGRCGDVLERAHGRRVLSR